ncbi:hypothetical protein HPP92_011327 [Vanilla planifolia]|uniref:Uncharacterized protein n=1 Tax=Vanilla planifolia TaxID=51239 RepID=A0A835QXD9_VANPL|nr:hypothetical protein HPP92_011327 [Vanilla planifolia]
MEQHPRTPPGDHICITLPLQSCAPTLFEPQRESNSLSLADDGCAAEDPFGPSSSSACVDHGGDAPETKLTLFALRLAILEKAASGVGALGFIWATVVLLGGFAIALERKDFWFVTLILLVEGARIFSRSHELEWQHQSTWSLAEAGALSFRAFRSSSHLSAPAIRLLFFSPSATKITRPSPAGSPIPDATRRLVVPHAGWEFLSKKMTRLLYWLQLASAAACAVLSLMRLALQDYGELGSDEREKQNRRPALNIFYGLALAEALLFLAERAYWEWKVSGRRILEEVNRDCGLGPSGMVSVRRFFYDAYSRCLNGSIFDGMRMDLVSFAEELLGSGSRDEQLIGVRILLRFATSRRFAEVTLRKLGTSAAAMERLVEILNWMGPEEEEIRRAAAIIVSKLAGKKQNALRVSGIPGAMESIASLLYTGHESNATRPEEISHKQDPRHRERYDYFTFNLLGLSILKKLANDHDNCGKIGNTRGLLPKIIDLTGRSHNLHFPKSAGADIQAAKRALQVVKMLAGTTYRNGQLLRREISENVFTVSNIRDILQRGGEEDRPLQRLGVEILTCLAMDAEARERIGATGGMMRELLTIFFGHGSAGGEEWDAVRLEAGEALAMLVVESEQNCRRVVNDGIEVWERLVGVVGDHLVGVNACRILRNLCAYGGHCFPNMRAVMKAFPAAFTAVMHGEMKYLEVYIGFASQLVRLMNPNEFTEELDKANIIDSELIERFVHILRRHSYPSVKSPRIRRFVIELSIWMMQSNDNYTKLFNDYEMATQLRNVAETTTDLECYIVFSGCVGLTRHRTTMSSLVDVALGLLGRNQSC